MNLDAIHDDIRYHTRNYLEKPNPPDCILHLNHSTGAGKTTIVCEELDNTDSLFIYLTDTHRIGEEQITKQKALYDLIQIESRRRLCKSRDYKELARHGINIKHFCPSCQYIQVCEYYQRILEIWDEPQSWLGVHHHLGGLVNIYAFENDLDAIVLDENFVNGIFKHTTINYTVVVKTSNMIMKLRDCKERELLYEFIKEFIFALQRGILNTEYLYTQVYFYFTRHGNNSMLLDFADEYESFLADYYFKKQKIFKNVITPLANAIIDIYNHYIPISQPGYLQYFNNVFRVNYGKKRRYIDIARYNLDALNLGCKILILDATTPSDFYMNIFMKEVKTCQKQLTRNATIYQLSTAKYVMQTLDRNVKTRQRLLNIVDMIVKKHEQHVLVLSRMKYEDEIKAICPELIVTDHYPIVGSNDYDEINICVAFGTPEPRRDILSRQSILLDYPEDELLYIMRETYILQGIGRIRSEIKFDIPTYIYLLTNLDLEIKNAKRYSLGKLERLLRNEVYGYVAEEVEDRIRDDILSLLEENEQTVTYILNNVNGKTAIKSEVITRLEDDNMIEIYKKETSGRGRKPKLCRLK